MQANGVAAQEHSPSPPEMSVSEERECQVPPDPQSPPLRVQLPALSPPRQRRVTPPPARPDEYNHAEHPRWNFRVVELREDIPLKTGASYGGDSPRCCGGGPRFILACFAALSAGITLALMTQIYYGDYEVVPHGSVSSSAANCSRAGTDILKAGGRAIDAAAAAAFCLAVLAPHRTSLDASGSLLYWEYRTSHAQPPILVEWGGPDPTPWANDTDRPPKMVAAFASLHSRLGALPWKMLLQPAITLARDGLAVTKDLSAAAALNNNVNLAPGSVRKAPLLADYLDRLQANTSSELAMSWGSDRLLRSAPAQEMAAGAWRVYAGGAGAVVAGTSLAATLLPPEPDADVAFQRVVSALQQASLHGEWPPAGVASGLAVVDRLDTYVALVTGLSKPFGSGPAAPGGWLHDDPKTQLDLAPAIIVDEHVCGTRYIVGAESSSALAQGATSLLTTDIGAGAVENARVSVFAGGVLAIEAARVPPAGLPVNLPTSVVNATMPYPAVNVVMQKGDSMTSHADSRGGGMASRF